MKSIKLRNRNGAALIVMMVVTGFLILGALGLFGYEVSRNNAAREELRSASEAAALAGAAALASSDSTDPTTAHNTALTAAQLAFRANSILGTSLNGATMYDSRGATSASIQNPTSGQSKFYLEFTDTSNVVQQWNNANGRIVRVLSSFGEEPSFGKFVGLPTSPVYSSGIGRVPKMDIVMCFDVSGSIDDQTPVTFVKRWWDSSKAKNAGSSTPAAAGAIRYDIAKRSDGKAAQDTIYGVLIPPATGTGVCAEPPMALDGTSSGSQYTTSFQASLRRGPSNGADSGAPPGNYPNAAAPGGQTAYTDMVTNIDGKTVFGGLPSVSVDLGDGSGPQNFSFPDVATLVEASRGNLEDMNVFKNSGAEASLPDTTVQPKAGYKKAYEQLRHLNTQPISDARVAAKQFFQIMNNNTSAAFGFLGFSTNVATTPNGTMPTAYCIANNYTPGGQVASPFQGTTFNSGSLSQILGNIDSTQANGSTNIGGACQEAVNELIANGRQGSTKAIIFFTDGQPTITTTSWQNAADLAGQKNIQIYTVGLAQNSAIIPGECDTLNDGANKTINYTDPITGNPGSYTPSGNGMAARGYTGGKFFLVSNRANLRFVFENIARQLVQLSKNG